MDWVFADSIVACPAGDSVVAGHPAALYNRIVYTGANGQGRNGVPPESIWVTLTHLSGAAVLNDAAKATDGYTWKVFADDSTRVDGTTHITVSGFSGCGSMLIRLYVDGIRAETRSIGSIRSTDSDDHGGRVTVADHSSTCDYNFDGVVDANDTNIQDAHMDHWNRQALHGTLVRRTNLRDFSGGDNSRGDGAISWSPNGKRITYSSRDTCPNCQLQKNPCRISTCRRIRRPETRSPS